MKPIAAIARRGCLALCLMSSPAASADDALFAYPPEPLTDSAPLVSTADGVTVTDHVFAPYPGQPDHAPLRVTIVRPTQAPDSAPGLLWGHWLGEPETSHRQQYLDEARAWARDHSATSVLVDALWSDPRWYRDRDLANDFAHGVKQVILFRRAMDLLLAQPGVDPDRTAFVAHDYSAMYGSIALAVDPRIRHAVFIAAAPELRDWAFYVTRPADLDAYLAENRPLHLPDYLARLGDRSILLQWAEEDFYIPSARREAFVTALAAEATVKIYPGAGHEMNAPDTIRADRTTWLAQALIKK